MKKKILIVDDEPNNLHVLRQILKESYSLVFSKNGPEALTAVSKHHPDLILLDIMMPEMNGYEVCRRLKESEETKHIPVIFITAMSDIDDESRGFQQGAVDYIIKPVSGRIVQARVSIHLSLVKNEALEKSQRDAVHMLGEAGHYNDTDTGLHIWRMAAYCKLIAKSVGWDSEACNLIELASPMHDMGKIGIDDALLKKAGTLTPEEWVEMRTHTNIGHEILSKSNSPVFVLAAEIALFHHEKWDGSGYPVGLSKEKIPESARIVAIADVFDALTMRRPYKNPWSIAKSIEEIKRLNGIHFDPGLVKTFVKIIPEILEIKEQWDKKQKD